MKIDGGKLAWAMIWFSFFSVFVYYDLPTPDVYYIIVYILFMILFGGLFIDNMKEAFK